MTRIDLTTREWHELVKPVVPHASTDKETPELGVVRVELIGHALYAVATDRYTLAAERHALLKHPGFDDAGPVHINLRDIKATLKLFTFDKDTDPPLSITVDRAPIPINHGHSVMGRALTISAGDGTRVMLYDVRDPSRDPLASWRKTIGTAMLRRKGRPLDGLDLHPWTLARWAPAARKGERLTFYTGTEPGDSILVTVEQRFAGIWAIPHYIDTPGKVLRELPWPRELLGDEVEQLDLRTGEILSEPAKPGEDTQEGEQDQSSEQNDDDTSQVDDAIARILGSEDGKPSDETGDGEEES